MIHPKLALWITVAAGILCALTIIAIIDAIKLERENQRLRTSLNTYKRENELYAAKEKSSQIIAKQLYKRQFDRNLACISEESGIMLQLKEAAK